MRQILAFIGLALFMVAAYLLYQVGQQSKRDGTIIGWANSLVWEALATPSSPLFQDSKVEPAAQGGGWTVTGRIVNVAADRNIPDGDYVAEVTRICAAGNERRCWKLSRLTIGDRFYVGSGIVALPKPSQQADRIRVKGARDGASPDGTSPDVTSSAEPKATAPQTLPGAEPPAVARPADSAAPDPPPPGAEATEGEPGGTLGTRSALRDIRKSLDDGSGRPAIPLVDQNGRPVPPIPARKP